MRQGRRSLIHTSSAGHLNRLPLPEHHINWNCIAEEVTVVIGVHKGEPKVALWSQTEVCAPIAEAVKSIVTRETMNGANRKREFFMGPPGESEQKFLDH